ncbi:hypothetical protein K1719_033413 [Acacia pycnantha]|nr:hypothetical protein K1719_033413 [Acacia pycnantha]
MDSENGSVSGLIECNQSRKNGCHSGPVGRPALDRKGANRKTQLDVKRGELASFRPKDFGFPCGTSPGRLFMECLSLSSLVSKFDDDDCDDVVYREDQYSRGSSNGMKKESSVHSGGPNHAHSGVPFTGELRQIKSGVLSNSSFGPKSRLAAYAPPSTLGHIRRVILSNTKLLAGQIFYYFRLYTLLIG